MSTHMFKFDNIRMVQLLHKCNFLFYFFFLCPAAAYFENLKYKAQAMRLIIWVGSYFDGDKFLSGLVQCLVDFSKTSTAKLFLEFIDITRMTKNFYFTILNRFDYNFIGINHYVCVSFHLSGNIKVAVAIFVLDRNVFFNFCP